MITTNALKSKVDQCLRTPPDCELIDTVLLILRQYCICMYICVSVDQHAGRSPRRLSSAGACRLRRLRESLGPRKYPESAFGSSVNYGASIIDWVLLRGLSSQRRSFSASFLCSVLFFASRNSQTRISFLRRGLLTLYPSKRSAPTIPSYGGTIHLTSTTGILQVCLLCSETFHAQHTNTHILPRYNSTMATSVSTPLLTKCYAVLAARPNRELLWLC